MIKNNLLGGGLTKKLFILIIDLYHDLVYTSYTNTKSYCIEN